MPIKTPETRELLTSKGVRIPTVPHHEALEKRLIPLRYFLHAPDRTVEYPYPITLDYNLSSERDLLISACEQLHKQVRDSSHQDYIVVLKGNTASIWKKRTM